MNSPPPFHMTLLGFTVWNLSLFCLRNPFGEGVVETGLPINRDGKEFARINRNLLPLFWKQAASNSVRWSQLEKTRCYPICDFFSVFFRGSHSNTELNMQIRREALRKIKGTTRVWPVCLKWREKAKKKDEAAPQPTELPHGGCLCPSRETHVLEGNKEQEGKKDKRKVGEVAGGKKKAQIRH